MWTKKTYIIQEFWKDKGGIDIPIKNINLYTENEELAKKVFKTKQEFYKGKKTFKLIFRLTICEEIKLDNEKEVESVKENKDKDIYIKNKRSLVNEKRIYFA